MYDLIGGGGGGRGVYVVPQAEPQGGTVCGGDVVGGGGVSAKTTVPTALDRPVSAGAACRDQFPRERVRVPPSGSRRKIIHQDLNIFKKKKIIINIKCTKHLIFIIILFFIIIIISHRFTT